MNRRSFLTAAAGVVAAPYLLAAKPQRLAPVAPPVADMALLRVSNPDVFQVGDYVAVGVALGQVLQFHEHNGVIVRWNSHNRPAPDAESVSIIASTPAVDRGRTFYMPGPIVSALV